jgi:hypothetical protein
MYYKISYLISITITYIYLRNIYYSPLSKLFFIFGWSSNTIVHGSEVSPGAELSALIGPKTELSISRPKKGLFRSV